MDLTFQQGQKRGRHLWEKPGRYLIRATYRWQRDQHAVLTKLTATSKPIRVRVEEPTGIDKKAYALLLKGKEQYLWNLSQSQAKNYQTLIRDYPNSRYAPYAHSFLAMHRDFTARSDGFSKKSVNEAVKEWLSSAERYAPFSFVDYNRSRAALLLHEANRHSESERLFREILADPEVPDSIQSFAEQIILDQKRDGTRYR